MKVFGSKDKCSYCHKKGICTKDHFWPKSKGGRLKFWACEICQKLKADKTPQEFIFFLANTGKTIPITYRHAVINSLMKITNYLKIEGINFKYEKKYFKH